VEPTDALKNFLKNVLQLSDAFIYKVVQAGVTNLTMFYEFTHFPYNIVFKNMGYEVICRDSRMQADFIKTRVFGLYRVNSLMENRNDPMMVDISNFDPNNVNMLGQREFKLM